MWSTGGKPPSNGSATRFPDPVMAKTRALPEAHPGRPTISCSTALRSGVRCAEPAWPRLQAGGAHGTEAVVSGREETLNVVVVNGSALSEASPLTVRFVATELFSSARN